MYLIFFLVSILASLIGSICGVGGGIIIKPVLDLVGGLDVAAISFLSGCTVLSMTIYSVASTGVKRETQIDFKIGTALAIGAAVGGVAGKVIFQTLWEGVVNKSVVSLIQAVFLIFITLLTFMYTLRMKKIKTREIDNLYLTALIGFGLGVLSSFLGIGGGPMNLAVLHYFFSMETKQAAENSLYVILFSQITSLLLIFILNSAPVTDILLLGGMILCGVIGGIIGKKLNKKITGETVRKLFAGLMTVIIIVNACNITQILITNL